MNLNEELVEASSRVLELYEAKINNEKYLEVAMEELSEVVKRAEKEVEDMKWNVL